MLLLLVVCLPTILVSIEMRHCSLLNYENLDFTCSGKVQLTNLELRLRCLIQPPLQSRGTRAGNTHSTALYDSSTLPEQSQCSLDCRSDENPILVCSLMNPISGTGLIPSLSSMVQRGKPAGRNTVAFLTM